MAKRRGLRICQQLGALGSLVASQNRKRRLRPAAACNCDRCRHVPGAGCDVARLDVVDGGGERVEGLGHRNQTTSRVAGELSSCWFLPPLSVRAGSSGAGGGKLVSLFVGFHNPRGEPRVKEDRKTRRWKRGTSIAKQIHKAVPTTHDAPGPPRGVPRPEQGQRASFVRRPRSTVAHWPDRGHSSDRAVAAAAFTKFLRVKPSTRVQK